MEITKKYLSNGQYITQEEVKKSIFLHHSVSTNADSAWRWWNSTPDRVGTAYIIDRDGSIIETFDPKMWAFHLGLRDDDNWQEKHSIGIELVSAGPLKFVDGEYRFYPLWPNVLRYTTIPNKEVVVLETPHFGEKFWHNYNKAQLESLKWLIGRLYMDFSELEFENDMEKFWEYDEDVLTKHKPGLWSHTTVNPQKSDIVPLPELISALKEVQSELTYAQEDAKQKKEDEISSKKVKAKSLKSDKSEDYV